MTAGEAPRYWWCLDHSTVETDEGCANSVRLGPFDDYATAEDALEIVRRRTEAWDSDPKWNDGAKG
ncbi:MAG: hypothetical protein LH645_12595 [Actinomycetia bacterium]|nr:hypothetical protein [Actinomycetes bacterium]